MDETYKKHAYQCLPVTYANVYGWELVLQTDVVAKWDGGNTVPTVIQGGEIEINGQQRLIAVGNIVGMVSFYVGYAFGTEPGYETMIGGSPNYFVDGAAPLSAIIPSSWWPDEFQMNWKITKIGEPVIFPAGMPFMFFTMFDSSIAENVEFETKNLWDDKELMQARMKYGDLKVRRRDENSWTWVKGIKTGLDADGNRIGPTFTGLPKLNEPGSQIAVQPASAREAIISVKDEPNEKNRVFNLIVNTVFGDEGVVLGVGEKLTAVSRGGQKIVIPEYEMDIVNDGSGESIKINCFTESPIRCSIELVLEKQNDASFLGYLKLGEFAQFSVTATGE